MKTIIRSLPATPISNAMIKAAICVASSPLPDGGTTLKWRLSDAHNQYGILLATLPVGRHLSHDQQQLVDTLVEQLTSTLALDRHQEKQQQLIVMEERATIAREPPDFRLYCPVTLVHEDAGELSADAGR